MVVVCSSEVGTQENHGVLDLEVLTAVAHWALQLMGKCLRSWSDMIEKRRQSRWRMRCFVEEEMIPAASRRTLHRWKLATVSQVHCRLVAGRQKAKVFRAWQWTVRQSSSTRILARKIEVRHCQKILDLWKKTVVRLARFRRILVIQRLRSKVKTCAKALSAWRLRAFALAALRCQRHCLRRRQRERVLQTWRQRCSQRHWGRMRLEMRRDHAVMLRLFRDWTWQVAAELTLRHWFFRRAALGAPSVCTKNPNEERHEEANSIFQRWKLWTLHCKDAMPEYLARMELLQSIFASWSHSVMVSKFTLRLEMKQAMRLMRGTWHIWKQSLRSMETASKHANHKLVAEVFQVWQMASVSIDLPFHLDEASTDLLEVSASTFLAQSGKDTEAPDDVNRTLSDLSGLTLTEGSPILPALAFDSSPEELKSYGYLIASSPSPLKEIGEKLHDLKKVPSAFQERAGISAPQEAEAASMVFSSAISGTQLFTAIAAFGSCQSDILNAWLGVCRTKTLREALKSRALKRHLWAWHQLWMAETHRRRALYRSSLMQWRWVQQTYVSRAQIFTQKLLQHQLSVLWHRWRDMLQRRADLADGQHRKTQQMLKKQVLAAWQDSVRLRKGCESMEWKQQRRSLVVAWRVWRNRCEQRHRAMAMFEGRMSHLAAKTWIAWCDYKNHIMHSAERMASALQRCIGSKLGRRVALQRWALQGLRGSRASDAQTFVQKRMRKVHLLAQLAQCVARWRHHLLHRVMRCWWKVPFRRLMFEKLKEQELQYLVAFLDRWKVSVRVTKSFRVSVMRCALRRWYNWRGLQRAGAKAQKVCRAATQSLALRVWRNLHFAQRHSKRAPSRRKQKAGAMLAWLAAVKTIRQQHLALRTTFRSWCDAVSKAQRLHSRRSLCIWRAVTRSRAWQRRVVQQWRRATLELQRQRLSKSFISWRTYHSAFLSGAGMASASRIVFLKESFSLWMQALSRWRAKQRVQVTCRQHRMGQALGAWSSLHQAALLGHQCLARHQPSSWALWRLGVAISKAQKSDLQKAMNFWRAGLLVVQLQRQKHIFCAWRAFVRSRHRRTAQSRFILLTWASFVQQSRRVRTGKCLAGWRAMTKVAAVERHHLVQSWSSWQQLLSEQRRALQRQQRSRSFWAWHRVLLSSRRSQLLCFGVFRRWHQALVLEKAEHRKKMKEWIFLWRRGIRNTKVLDFTWVHWQLLSAATTRRRGRAALRLWYHESHRRRQGKALLGAWRVVVSLSRLPYLFHAWRSVLFWRRLSNSSLRFTLRWWQAVAHKARSMKKVAFRGLLMAFHKRRCQLLSTVLKSWQVSKTNSRRDLQLKRLVLESWISIRDARIQQTKSMRRFAKCCERSMVMAAEASARATARIFHAWRSLSRQRLARQKCAEALQAARQRPLRMAFDHFHSVVLEHRQFRQRCRPLAQQLSACCQRRLFSGWSRLRQHIDCLRFRDRRRWCLAESALKAWQGQHLHRKSLEAAVKGIATRQNQRFCLTYLHCWYSAARRCRLSEWMLRWRCAVASQMQKEDLAKAFFRQRLLQRAFGLWALGVLSSTMRSLGDVFTLRAATWMELEGSALLCSI